MKYQPEIQVEGNDVIKNNKALPEVIKNDGICSSRKTE